VPPTENDGVLDLDHDGDPGEDEMADQAEQAHVQNMAALQQTGVVAQNHFVGFTKLADYDYLEGHRLIGLTEAVGVREVSSKSVPAGPTVT
jgi:hypothetical protein